MPLSLERTLHLHAYHASFSVATGKITHVDTRTRGTSSGRTPFPAFDSPSYTAAGKANTIPGEGQHSRARAGQHSRRERDASGWQRDTPPRVQRKSVVAYIGQRCLFRGTIAKVPLAHPAHRRARRWCPEQGNPPLAVARAAAARRACPVAPSKRVRLRARAAACAPRPVLPRYVCLGWVTKDGEEWIHPLPEGAGIVRGGDSGRGGAVPGREWLGRTRARTGRCDGCPAGGAADRLAQPDDLH